MINLLTNISSVVLRSDVIATYTKTISGGTAAITLLVFFVIAAAILAALVAGTWKVFQKAGKPGWAAIIPFYATWVLFEVGDYPGWLGLGSVVFISIADLIHAYLIIALAYLVYFVLNIMVAIKIADKFGKSIVFAILGLAIFPFVGYPILGFGDAKYDGGSGIVTGSSMPLKTPIAPTPPPSEPSSTVAPDPNEATPPAAGTPDTPETPVVAPPAEEAPDTQEPSTKV